MTQLHKWSGAKFALLYGEDSDGRILAINAWKKANVDPEWEAFSFTECSEGCLWPEVINALQESAPMGKDRAVLVPQADNLLGKGYKIPPEVKQMLLNPIFGTRLLLVVRCNLLSNSADSILNAKPFSEWSKDGSVLKVGNLNTKNVVDWISDTANDMHLKLDIGVAKELATKLGDNPGVIRRALELLDLVCNDKHVTIKRINDAVFTLGEGSTFLWLKYWQSGSIVMGLQSLDRILNDDPSSEKHLMLLGQAKREVEILCNLFDAKRSGLKGRSELMLALGLSPRQDFLFDAYVRVLNRIGSSGLQRLLNLIHQTELDIKGQAISKSITPLMNLTIALCRAWSK